MTTFSRQAASPRKSRLNPVYPAILGVGALLLLGGCKGKDHQNVSAAGGAEPIFDAAQSTADSDAAPPVSPGGAVPSPNVGGGKSAPFEQGKDAGDSGAAVRDAGRKPPPPPPPQPPGGMPPPHVPEPPPAAPTATIAK